ncbi:hypothetical protein MMC25_002564 [Agyrium rufum]|nr:hypothetical protein [Agyrium rufum]
MPSATLIKPPPLDASQSPIENVLELTELAAIGPDIYTNTRPLWHPPGARGIYGGAAIAQCLAAAQKTIPPPSPANKNAVFLIHSMHCYFVLAGDASIPVLYHVERVREGKSFMTRTVQARQRGKCIFTTTASFVREGSAGKRTIDHGWELPEGVLETLGEETDELSGVDEQMKRKVVKEMEANGEDSRGPFESRRMGVHKSMANLSNREVFTRGYPDGLLSHRGCCEQIYLRTANYDSPHPHKKRTRSWIRARGTISPDKGIEPHLSALAYMSDSYFIGTISRVHNLWRFSKDEVEQPSTPASKARKPISENPSTTTTSSSSSTSSSTPTTSPAPEPASHPPSPPSPNQNPNPPRKPPHEMALLEQSENGSTPRTPARSIGMMVSLDHTIYFHRPRAIKADEWMFSEMESPWAGDGRGLVLQRIWNKEGVLVATCVQEGLARLRQDDDGDDDEGVRSGAAKSKL